MNPYLDETAVEANPYLDAPANPYLEEATPTAFSQPRVFNPTDPKQSTTAAMPQLREAGSPEAWGNFKTQMGNEAGEVWNTVNAPLWKVSEQLKITPQQIADAMDVLKESYVAPVKAGMDLAQGRNPVDSFVDRIGQQSKKPGAIAKVAAGANNAVTESLDFFTSPLGIATLGTGALPQAAQKAVALAFVVQMSQSAPEQYGQFLDAKYAGDVEGMAKGLTGMGLTAAFIYQGARHTAAMEPKAVNPYLDAKKPIMELADQTPPVINQETGTTEFQKPVDEVAPVSESVAPTLEQPVQQASTPEVTSEKPLATIADSDTGNKLDLLLASLEHGKKPSEILAEQQNAGESATDAPTPTEASQRSASPAPISVIKENQTTDFSGLKPENPYLDTPAKSPTSGKSFAEHTILDDAKDHGSIGGIDLETAMRRMDAGQPASKITSEIGGEYDALANVLETIHEARKKGKQFAQYRDLAAAYERAGFNRRGRVDEVLQGMANEGRAPESESHLIEQAWDAAQGKSKSTFPQDHEGKADLFWKTATDPQSKTGLRKITSDQLKVGQTFRLRGKGLSHEELRVTHIDPDTGAVTVKDGTIFGVQELPEGVEIYVTGAKDVLHEPGVDNSALREDYQPDGRSEFQRREQIKADAGRGGIDRRDPFPTSTAATRPKSFLSLKESFQAELNRLNERIKLFPDDHGISGQAAYLEGRLDEMERPASDQHLAQLKAEIPEAEHIIRSSGQDKHGAPQSRRGGGAQARIRYTEGRIAQREADQRNGRELFEPPQDDFFNKVESIEEQKSRLKQEAQAKAAKEKEQAQRDYVQRGGDKLTGKDLDTTKEMFGAEVKVDKAGQGSLFESEAEAKRSKEIADRMDKAESKPRESSPQLVRDVIERKGTVRGALTAIGQSKSAYAPLAKALLATADGKSLAIKLGIDPKSRRSTWFPDNERVDFAPDAVKDTYRIMHELWHPLTATKLKNSPQMKALFEQAKKLIDGKHYGLGRVEEFIAEAGSNPDFMRKLDAVKIPNEPQTLWQKFISTARKVLRLPPEMETLLDKVLREGAKVAGEERPDLKRYRNAAVSEEAGLVTIRPLDAYERTAYHGTPHKVDKFSTDKIGTGEGAQVYGYGLYFAENKEVSTQYRRNLSVKIDHKDASTGEVMAAHALSRADVDFAKAKQDLIRQNVNAEDADRYLNGAAKKGKFGGGNEYTVSLDVDHEDLLDWDKPLSEQSESIQRAAKDEMSRIGGSASTGERLYREMVFESRKNGSDSPESSASKRLVELGIPGIKYLDQGSRNAGDWKITPPHQTASGKWMVKNSDYNSKGIHFDTEAEAQAALKEKQSATTYNYVMFDDSKIKITHENGKEVEPRQDFKSDILHEPKNNLGEDDAERLTNKGATPLSKPSISLDKIPQEGENYEIVPKGDKDPLGYGSQDGKFFLTNDNRWIAVEEHDDAGREILKKSDFPLRADAGEQAGTAALQLDHNWTRIIDNGGEIYIESSNRPTTSQLRELKNVAIESRKKLVQSLPYDPKRPQAATERVIYDPSESGDILHEPEPARDWRELKSDFDKAQEQLKEAIATHHKDAKALATAIYREARAKLRGNDGYIEHLLLEHQKATGPERESLRVDLEQLKKGHVNRVYDDLIKRGLLPDTKPIRNDNSGRTLDKISNWMKENKSDSPKRSFLERLNLSEQTAQRFNDAKDAASVALAKAQGGWKGLVDLYKNPGKPDTDFRKVMKSWIYADQRTGLETRRFVQELNKQVENPIRRQALSVWLDAGGDAGLIRMQSTDVPARYEKVWKAALTLTPKEKALALKIKADFEAKLEDAMSEGLVEKGRADYGVPQRWEKPPEGDAKTFAEDAKKGSANNPNAKLDPRDPFFSFQRTHESYFDGIMAKGIPKSLDIGHLVADYDASFHKALSSRGAIAAMREARAADGLPVVKISGSAVKVGNGETGAVLVDSRKQAKADVSEDGRPYRSIDHFALKDWVVRSKDADGTPIIVKGDFLVHPDHYEFLKNELQQSALRQGAVGKVVNPILKSNAFLKSSKLAFAGFHLATIAEHMASHLESPLIGKFKLDLANPDQKLLVKNGLELGMGAQRVAYEEGLSSHGGLFSKIPGIGDYSAKLTDWMFKDYIPTIMMKVATHTLKDYRKRYAKEVAAGKITDEGLAQKVAEQLNAGGGLLNYRLMEGYHGMGRSKAVMDLSRMALLAPQFLEARARVVSQAFQPYGHSQRKLLITQAIGLYVGARILNALFNDDKDPHWEAENMFNFVHKGRAYSIRTILGDVVHAFTDPKSFAAGRLSPLSKGTYETITQRDLRTGARKEPLFQTENQFSRVAQNFLADLANWFVPIGVDGIAPGHNARGQSPTRALLGSFGVGSKKYNASTQISHWAKDFNRNSPDPAANNYQQHKDGASFGEGDYLQLDNLLDAEDFKAAASEYAKLLQEGKKAPDIAARYRDLDRPFTGKKTREALFRKSLTENQRKTYAEAINERRTRLEQYRKMRTAYTAGYEAGKAK